MRLLSVTCIAQVVAAVDAVQPDMVSVSASGLAKTVVRRAGHRVQAQTSAFAGLIRSDRFSFDRGMNCSSDHGGAELGTTMGMHLKDCQRSCLHDDGCTCVNFEASTGKCGKHRFCNLEDCVPSALVDTYMLHTTLKLPKGKKEAVPKRKLASHHGKKRRSRLAHQEEESFATPPKRKPAQPQGGLSEGSIAKSTSSSGVDVRDTYERSGSRNCVGLPVLESHHEDLNLSVKQCLTLCDDLGTCTCVRYDRYYQNGCDLLSNCTIPASNHCIRDNSTDMYVHLTRSPTTSNFTR